MTTANHIVLGGNGIAGQETIKALRARGLNVSSVGRRPSSLTGVTSEFADLLIAADVDRVMEGKEVAYFTVGLPYSAKVWAEQWPVMLKNVADAAVRNDTHLVYLDNVYAYGEVAGPMTEETPLNPVSKKGEVRENAARMLAAAREHRGLRVTIARSADFYGPGAATSPINGYLIDRVAQGKTGQWMIDSSKPHSLTYTPDLGAGLALLGVEPAAINRTWHLPTGPALTGRDYAELVSGPGAKVQDLKLWFMRVGSLFNSGARESLEMAYQYNKPYVFDSSLFETTFGVAPTSYAEGFAAALAAASAEVKSR